MGAFSVERMTLVRIGNDRNKVRAFVDVKIAEKFMVKNLRVVEGEKGHFVGMPQEKDKKDDKWYETCFPTSKEAYSELQEVVLKAFETENAKV